MNNEYYHRAVAIGVDMQNDFCPGGSLGVPEGDAVIHPFNQVASWTRTHRGIVALTRDWHPEKTNHFVTDGGPWPPHCVAHTPGAAFHDDLVVRDGDPILSKSTRVNEDAYSGFQGADHDGMTLETLLTPVRHERVAVLIGGLATDYCVKATVLDALELARQTEARGLARHLGVFVLEDAIRAVNVNPEDGTNAIAEMRAAGAVFITSEQLLHNEVMRIRN